MTSLEAAIAIMKTDLESGKASKRSLGVIYAMLMAGGRCEGPDFWKPVNDVILAKHDFRYLDDVKKVAWSIFEQAGKSHVLETSPPAGTA